MYRISTALQEQKGSGTYRVDAQAADFSKLGIIRLGLGTFFTALSCYFRHLSSSPAASDKS
jgi:hypothetical protein